MSSGGPYIISRQAGIIAPKGKYTGSWQTEGHKKYTTIYKWSITIYSVRKQIGSIFTLLKCILQGELIQKQISRKGPQGVTSEKQVEKYWVRSSQDLAQGHSKISEKFSFYSRNLGFQIFRCCPSSVSYHEPLSPTCRETQTWRRSLIIAETLVIPAQLWESENSSESSSIGKNLLFLLHKWIPEIRSPSLI